MEYLHTKMHSFGLSYIPVKKWEPGGKGPWTKHTQNLSKTCKKNKKVGVCFGLNNDRTNPEPGPTLKACYNMLPHTQNWMLLLCWSAIGTPPPLTKHFSPCAFCAF